MEVKSLPEIERKLSHRNKSLIALGGEFIPGSTSTLVKGDRHMHEECTIIDNSKYKMAIIVPFRDRPDHLRIFLNNMHPYLMRQRLHYKIFLVEPHSNLTFNRGMLKNIGFVEAMKDSNKWNCFMFHVRYAIRFQCARYFYRKQYNISIVFVGYFQDFEAYG